MGILIAIFVYNQLIKSKIFLKRKIKTWTKTAKVSIYY